MTRLERAAAGLVCVGFDGPVLSDALRELIRRGVSSVILFSRNYQSPAQLISLCQSIRAVAQRPILIGVDQEGGRVQRFGEPFTIIPPMRDVGARDDVALARALAATVGHELRAVGVDMNLAPVLDVDTNPVNPVIGERSFGRDPDLVARLGCAFIEGLQNREAADGGVAACGKHFPGHGDTSVDSHQQLPRLPHDLDRLRRVELPPFAAAINAGVAAIMVGHLVVEAIDPAQPATLSHAVVTDLLRTRLGFRGLILSDDLEMKAIVDHVGIEDAAVQGVEAGLDLLLICSRTDLQHRAIDAVARAAGEHGDGRRRLEHAAARREKAWRRFGHDAGQSSPM